MRARKECFMHRKETPKSRERSSKFAVCSDGLERHGRFDASITESEEARLQKGFCTRREKLREGEGEGEVASQAASR